VKVRAEVVRGTRIISSAANRPQSQYLDIPLGFVLIPAILTLTGHFVAPLTTGLKRQKFYPCFSRNASHFLACKRGDFKSPAVDKASNIEPIKA
jgi:hypothetical protein